MSFLPQREESAVSVTRAFNLKITIIMKKMKIFRYLFMRSIIYVVIITIILWIVGACNHWYSRTYHDAVLIKKTSNTAVISYDNGTKVVRFYYPWDANDGKAILDAQHHNTYVESNYTWIFILTMVSICLFGVFVCASKTINDIEAKGWVTYYVLRFLDYHPSKPTQKSHIYEWWESTIDGDEPTYLDIARDLLNNKNEEK